MPRPLSLAALGGLVAHFDVEVRRAIEYGLDIGLHLFEIDQVGTAWLEHWRHRRVAPDFHQLREALHARACDRAWRPPA